MIPIGWFRLRLIFERSEAINAMVLVATLLNLPILQNAFRDGQNAIEVVSQSASISTFMLASAFFVFGKILVPFIVPEEIISMNSKIEYANHAVSTLKDDQVTCDKIFSEKILEWEQLDSSHSMIRIFISLSLLISLGFFLLTLIFSVQSWTGAQGTP